MIAQQLLVPTYANLVAERHSCNTTLNEALQSFNDVFTNLFALPSTTNVAVIS